MFFPLCGAPHVEINGQEDRQHTTLLGNSSGCHLLETPHVRYQNDDSNENLLYLILGSLV